MSVNAIRLVVLVLVLLIGGIGLTVSGISTVIKLSGEIPDFNYDSMQNIESGDFVGGYVPLILDCYASETTTESTLGIETSSRTSEEYFLMPLMNESDWDKELYITISAGNYDDRQTLYEICDQTWEYYDGNENVRFTEFPIICKVKEIDSDLEPLLLDCFREAQWYENDAEIREHYLPYELVIYNSSPYTNLIIGVILLAAGVVIVLIVWKKLRPRQEIETAYNAAGYVSNTPVDSSGGFAEEAPAPFPDIPQPPSPDEFFERTPRTPKEPVQAEQPESAPETVPQTAPTDYGDMDTLDTSSLTLDDLDN